MVTTSGTDLGTLGWVKDEIDETLKQARLALEAFTEERTDEAKLRLCATYLHQVGGTLKMVELDPLAQLVSEAESLVQALLDGIEAPSEAVLEPLARVLLSIPDILDRAQVEGLGNGLELLPIANELRAARGIPPLAPQAIFAPDLSVRPPKPAVADDRGFAELFRKQRTQFQKTLLRWLKGPRAVADGQAMADLLEDWRAATASVSLAQCLWVGSAFLRFLTEQAEPPLESQKLLGRLDQLLRRFVDGHDKGGTRTGCERLTREMLFALREGPSTDSSVAAIRAAFGFTTESNNVLPSPSISALRSIASALSQEITEAQGLLSRCFDPGQEAGGALDDELIQLLDKMGKTFSALDIVPLKDLVQTAAEVCRAVAEGQFEKTGPVAMVLAQALLQIETAIREIPSNRGGWQLAVEERRQALASLGSVADTSGVEVSEAPLSEQDRRQLIGAVGGEIRANLKRIEEGFLAFVAAPADHGLLAELPTLAAQVEAAFRVVEDEAAADLGHELRDALDRFASGVLAPRGAPLEALAAAVAGLEAQVVGLQRGRVMPESQLQALTSALQTLADGAVGGAQSAVPESASSADRDGPASSAPATVALADLQIDPEILPVFLEDAHQAVTELEEALPAWTTNATDERAIGLARRAFHTLKGSGRMVEAGEIAELAYDAESLLNKIRGRQMAPGADALKWVTAAYEVVRAWVEAVEQNKPLPYMGAVRAALQDLNEGRPVAENAAVATMRLRADGEAAVADEVASESLTPKGLDFSGGGGELAPTVDHDEASPVPPAAEHTAAETSSAPGGLLASDPLLLDIFVAETRDHLVVLHQALTAGPAEPVSATLLRAAHTMQGSARSVGLAPMAEACAGIERYLQALELSQEQVGDEGIELLADLVSTSEAFLGFLQGDSDANPDFAALTTRLANHPKEASAHSERTWWQKNLETQETARDEGRSAADESAGASENGYPVPTELGEQEAAEGRSMTPSDTYSAYGSAPVEDADPELREIFRDEARDLLETIEGAFADWRGRRQSDGPLQALKRALHTLKGGARMCGGARMGDFAHATEELLRRVEDKSCARDDHLFALLDSAVERLGMLYKEFLSGQPLSDFASEQALVAELRGEEHEAQGSVLAPGEVAMPAHPPEVSPPISLEDEDFSIETTTKVRVRTALLDRLVNYAGEVSIARSRMEQQIFSLREHLAELNGNVKRFRDQVRELEIQAESQIGFRAQVGEGSAAEDFDPLEFDRFTRLQQLSRGLTENLHDLVTLHGTLDTVASQAEAVLQQQARVNTELQEGLMRTRMVGFATQAHRLRQIVRQTSRELNKRVDIVLEGAEVEMDRHLLERMIGPFEHMIRNAIDHGLESTAERERLGKPAIGVITVQASQESGEIVIRVSDDGAGLPIERIHAKAIERKLLPPGATVTDEQIMQFILLPGFSTAAHLTRLSGRGVGMDVVHSEVKKLGGTITVDTKAGRGTTFVIRLPLTLSITQALMVGCGDQLFAIPLAAIINIVEAPGGTIADALLKSRPILRYGGKDYPFMDLGMRLGLARSAIVPRKSPVLLLRLDTREVAVAVDSLAGTREIVVKSLGPQLGEIRGLFGATILGDGRVLLILDIPALWTEEEGLHLVPTTTEAPVVTRPYVVVVDDSLTVRKVTGRFLQKQGYDSASAKDGIEALELLRDRIPDVMLVDIEMPRMDGYELTSRIRDEARLRHIPIIMITSRSGNKHRERAMSLGVDAYLGKPYQEEDLRKEIEAMLRRGRI
ncbi:MAG TPA: Hpt domain-containing protein [Acidiferrobacter sp.]|nr:Hpt domain-containing protein [Acidiferrobacter sp.]